MVVSTQCTGLSLLKVGENCGFLHKNVLNKYYLFSNVTGNSKYYLDRRRDT